jgi:hypothetical protein
MLICVKAADGVAFFLLHPVKQAEMGEINCALFYEMISSTPELGD